MRISDWSSDVGSSDLTAGLTYGFQERTPVDAAYRKARIDDFDADYTMDSFLADLAKIPLQFDPGAPWTYSMATDALGLASCRARVCQSVEISVYAVSLKKTNSPTPLTREYQRI